MSKRGLPPIALFFFSFLIAALSGCGKTVAFEEEVDIGAKETVRVKRWERFEGRVHQLAVRQKQIESEFEIVGSGLPKWRGDLRPMYLGRLPDQSTILVASIPDATTCVRRGRPKSPYVAFIVVNSVWRESPFPTSLYGTAANLLLTVDPLRDEGSLVARETRIFRNKVGNPGSTAVMLNIPYGC